MKAFYSIIILVLSFFFTSQAAFAEVQIQQEITLFPGWNIVSTPMTLSGHEFSVAETVDNFDVYLLDASQPTGWSTMAAVGQTEFLPLYGYFVNNKTGVNQVLTFNYESSLEPNDKLFERTFDSEGWYSIGVANDEYAKDQDDDRSDVDNPSKILSLLSGKYDLMVDFTATPYETNRRSVSVGNPWDVVVPSDINSLNDLRETKGYAIYIKEAGAKYVGFQNDPATSTVNHNEENELIVKESTNNPDSSVLQVENDRKSDWYTVFSFLLDSGESVDDLELNSLPITVELSTSTFSEVVADVELYIDGLAITDYSVIENGTEAEITFNVAGDIVIYSGEQVDANLNIRFKSMSEEGVTISAKLDSADEIEVQGIIQLIPSQLSGSAYGETHQLRSAGMVIESVYKDASVTVNDGAENDYGTFEIELEITAFEQDVYIATDPNVSMLYLIQDATGSTSISGSQNVVLTSTVDEAGSYFEIAEGSTETLTLTVTYAPGVANTAARMVLGAVSYNETMATPNQTQYLLPVTDYRTHVVTIVN